MFHKKTYRRYVTIRKVHWDLMQCSTAVAPPMQCLPVVLEFGRICELLLERTLVPHFYGVAAPPTRPICPAVSRAAAASRCTARHSGASGRMLHSSRQQQGVKKSAVLPSAWATREVPHRKEHDAQHCGRKALSPEGLLDLHPKLVNACSGSDGARYGLDRRLYFEPRVACC